MKRRQSSGPGWFIDKVADVPSIKVKPMEEKTDSFFKVLKHCDML